MSKHLCIIHQTCGDKPCPLCAIPTGPVSAKEVRDLPKKILAPSLPAVPDTKDEELLAWRRQFQCFGSTPAEAAKEINVMYAKEANEVQTLRKALEKKETRGRTTWECGCGTTNGVNLAACGVCNRPRCEGEVPWEKEKALEKPGAVAANTVQGPMERIQRDLRNALMIEEAATNCAEALLADGEIGVLAIQAVARTIKTYIKTACQAWEKPFPQIRFETGGRNALNLQMALQELCNQWRLENDDSYDACASDLEKCLQSAQAASDGKEQGER